MTVYECSGDRCNCTWRQAKQRNPTCPRCDSNGVEVDE